MKYQNGSLAFGTGTIPPPFWYQKVLSRIDHRTTSCQNCEVQVIWSGTVVFLLCAGPGVTQTISIEQLSHRVPASAAREYAASVKALETGDIRRSIEHCQKAIEADPDNASAHNDLGVLYLDSGRPEEALSEFRRAIALQPRLTAALVNASFASLTLGHSQDAETFARGALGISGSDHHAHLLLGWSLVSQFRFTSAALDSLRIAEREFPEARLAAADVLVHQGSFDSARAEVEAYLATGNEEYRALAQSWLRLLTLQ
jgi:Tfp pilus assembly protein PilF